MKFPKAKRRPLFETLPRHKRSNHVILLKNTMRRFAADFGGRFTSWTVLNEPGCEDLDNQYYEFHFLGADRLTIWAAEITTAQHTFWGAAHHEASSRALAAMGIADLSKESMDITEWERRDVRYAQFDGRTRYEQIYLLEKTIIREEPPAIYESFKFDWRRGYKLLSIVLDVEVINQAAIESAIDRFLAVCETDWVSPEPVPRDRLPLVSQHEARGWPASHHYNYCC